MPVNSSATIRSALQALTLTTLAGCVIAPFSDREWPADIPPQSYYERLYESDAANRAAQTLDDYLIWVTRFYVGWEGYPRGWRDISREATGSIPQERREVVGKKFYRLGKFISGEWAKDSRSRAIFTKTVAAWGDALFEAVQREEVEALLDRVAEDIENLLAGQLAPEAITLDRYYSDTDDRFPFAP
jgi:hypothetical protein